MGEEKLTYSVDEVAKLLGISRNSAFSAVQAGEIPSIRIGHRRLVPRLALERKLLAASGEMAGGPIAPSNTEPSREPEPS
jgi:excisionase family DNA binding protein